MTIFRPMIRPIISRPIRSVTSKAQTTGTQLIVDLTDANAMVIDLQDDLASVVPQGATVTLTDTASGFIGTGYAKRGTGSETLGSEQAPDPTMDIACGGAGWVCDAAGFVISGGVASVSAPGVDKWVYKYGILTPGQLLKTVLNVSSYTAGNFFWDLDGGFSVYISQAGVHEEYLAVPLAGGSYGGFVAKAGTTGEVTSASLKQVTSPGSTGLEIHKNSSLTIRGWASTGAGNPNYCDKLEYL